MNRVERLGRWATTPTRCVVMLLLALLTIVSIPGEAQAQVTALSQVSAPTGLVVKSAERIQIVVEWTGSAGAATYHVERSTAKAGPYAVISSGGTATSFTDMGVVAGKTYVYRVRAVNSRGEKSQYSNSVMATAVTFTDHAITAGTTPIKAQHFTELRQAVNAVRSTAGLPAAAWTDPSLAGANVKGTHMQEMRNSLTQALTALKVAAPAFSDNPVASGFTPIRKAHLDELRASATRGIAEADIDPDILPPAPCPADAAWPTSDGTVVANVVAIDQVLFYNRLGAFNPAGMIFALERDVVAIDKSKPVGPGNAQLRPDKRPRPLTLRVNAGQKLQINFKNWLADNRKDDNQPATRTASVHVMGLQLVNSINDDGSYVGRNDSSLVAPGGSKTYTYFAPEREGNHLMYSTAATTGGEADGGSLAMGLFGSVNVEPKGAEWYRSQVTAAEMRFATKGSVNGQPLICYDAVYPERHPKAGQPVLRMLSGNEIIHSDLNALITGPDKGRFPAGTFVKNEVEPDREQPFREFTVVYHDEVKAIQAFPHFEEEGLEKPHDVPNPNPALAHTLHSVRDAFAINYGTGGIGAEILANRLGVGPMADCVDCLYEEFFLSAWAVGDPAQIVDIPANALEPGTDKLQLGRKATRVLYPDDPSNVHHSYLNDHVKMRVVHAGPKEHHVHHLHAHQWLHTPDSDKSSYLDSQAMGPGYAFTTEIAHGGSGNRNKTPGDSIFHCHFYPHFAQGMWELWRVHDVFEAGTQTDVEGRPNFGSRALPDGEIAAGTPIPGLVPLPTIAMAPLPTAAVSIVNGQPQVPTAGFPGFPFYVPGVAGHRPPHPPLDTEFDGGLPRHVIRAGKATHHESHDEKFDVMKARLDFDKHLEVADALDVPETGTAAELVAMNFHAAAEHSSVTPEGVAAGFKTNGLPAVKGAPFADPCRMVDDQVTQSNLRPFGAPRTYKSANIQLDVIFNKAKWHFGQQRIAVLWDDVKPTLDGTRPPEPLFFRANTDDCITFHHTNLVPKVYVQDDFQVRTPTDIMGQHIHLVKFDVMASDGAGNGWNYEDGTFSPEEVLSRIEAINLGGGLLKADGSGRVKLSPKTHPLGVVGAQTTIQRWFADDVMNNGRTNDRTLRTVFTHDHFGPSTHQQVGFYQGLVVEPKNSKWRHPETGEIFGTRLDGGPTSWRADILTANPAHSYREFLLEFSDFQLAYRPDGTPVNPPVKNEVGLPKLVLPADRCPGTGEAPPCPEAVSAADPGTMVVNYRNEPIPLRILNNPNGEPSPSNPTQAAGLAGDLSHVFRSLTSRSDPRFNTQHSYVPPLTLDVQPGDPVTPMLRAYEDDKVQVRVLVGGFEESHNFGVQGMRWLFEPSDPNSGFRANQMMGISEHYEFEVPQFPRSTAGQFVDYRYAPGSASDDLWNGLWGLLRAYSAKRSEPRDILLELPNNPKGLAKFDNKATFNGICPAGAPPRPFDITAIMAKDVLTEGTLVYNFRTNQKGRLNDPFAIMYVRTEDIGANGKLNPELNPEPLILRANAGDCIEVTLRNKLPDGAVPDPPGFSTMPMIVNGFNANEVTPSNEVGLNPQLVFYDVSRSNGMNVGHNTVQTVKPGHSTTYQWYAGSVTIDNSSLDATKRGMWNAAPVEFGAVNLMPADPIKHSAKGAIGALVIEPQGSKWPEYEMIANPDPASTYRYLWTRSQVTVTKADGTTFRDFVLLFQNDLNLKFGDGSAVPNTAEAEDSEDSGQKAFNYRTEPLWKRMDFAPETHLSCGDKDEFGNEITECTNNKDFTRVLSNTQVGGDPVTPIFTARAGQQVRFRILHPGGHARNNVFQVHGHIWEEEPYVLNSTALGENKLSEWKSSQYGVGPGSHFDVLPKYGAGGRFARPGDYLYRDQGSFPFSGGLWGIFRVEQ